ncbi:hypothetical protein [Collimonas silvisoli]|uniref:hypothetical protein n=1 Tax=Collimonas silvisoli TaxID=2825884 RepID=UPI001B8CF7E5|nr:hypothetical protein [Collimonas silvisoli]
MTVDTDADWCVHLGDSSEIAALRAGIPFDADHSQMFDQYFQLHDENTGEIFKNRFYKIRCSSGSISGYTDASGFTKKVTANSAEEVKIEIFGEGI